MEETLALLRPTGVHTPRLEEPDEDLLDACRRGDREALGRLFLETRAFVYGVALHTTGEAAAAADATQEVYLKVMAHIGQFAGRAGFRTWLFRIAVNAARDQLRRSRRYTVLDAEHDEVDPRTESPQRDLLAREHSALVRRHLASLAPRLREPLVLRYVAGLSYEEIGRVLALRPGTVASRLSRGLAELGRAMQRVAGEEV
jgi:RNA polymerase sigma-70 factor (ECF subfamily)